MKKYKTVLINLSVLVEVPEEILEDEELTEIYKLENTITDTVESIESPYKLSWESSRSMVLDAKEMNCGTCKSCGCWVSNREGSHPMLELNIGAIHRGDLLCDECLPKDHKLVF